MKLTDIILNEEKNCGCGQTPCITYGINEELGVSKRKLAQVIDKHGEDFLVDMIMSIEDENILDTLVDALQIN